MMTRAPNKIFAIAQNTLVHPELGHTVPHIFGAIFDVDAAGKATDCTTIDFDGAIIRKWERNNYGMKKCDWVRDHLVGAEKALFFPITEESASLLKEAMDDLAESLRTNRNPFYFAGIPVDTQGKYGTRFERKGFAPRMFDGSERTVSYAEKLTYTRTKFDRPRAATNCMQFLQDVMEKIAGVPVKALQLEGKEMPCEGDTYAMQRWLDELSGNKGKPSQQWKQGRLIDMGEGRYAFAYGYNSTTGSITSILNDMPKQRTKDGHEILLTQFFMQESRPFCDPKLNDYDLGRNAKAMSSSR